MKTKIQPHTIGRVEKFEWRGENSFPFKLSENVKTAPETSKTCKK